MTTRHEAKGTGHGEPAKGVYGNWKAPIEDGGLLIWPEALRIVDLARRNRSLRTRSDPGVGRMPLREPGAEVRDLLTDGGEGPLFATGHQCELQHPGVWIKNAVVCAAAEASGGRAVHIGVDTDAPKHLKLKWPGFSAPITDDPRANSAAWSGLLAPPTAKHLDYLVQEAEAAKRAGKVSELLVRFLEGIRSAIAPLKTTRPLSLPQALLAAQHALDVEVGLEYEALPLSRLLETEQYRRFVIAIAGDGRDFASIYNAALAAHRLEAGIDSPERPAPDLLVTRKHVELPFWLDDRSTGRRQRAELLETGGSLALEAPPGRSGSAAPFKFTGATSDPSALLAWLQANHLRLAPRALSLTMFLRLVVCDLFVHGIGGGLYDQVTDRIIRNWLGTDPPAFAVATATLLHPLAAGRGRVDLPALRREQHKQAHDVLGLEKRSWLERIAATRDSRERRWTFEAMHRARRDAISADSDYLEAQHRLQRAQVESSVEREIFDRELLYLIQPRPRLEALLGKVRSAFGL